MARASYMQTSFLGGIYSPSAQGRMDNPAYKTGLNELLNYVVLEEGGVSRRPGFKSLGITRHGAFARLLDFDFTSTQPYQMEFTDSFLRLWADEALVTTSDVVHVATITQDNPAVVYLTGAVPAGWANGDSIYFTLNSQPCSAPLLCGQQYRIAGKSGSTFTLQDAVTGANIDGADIAYVNPTGTLDTVSKIYEIATPYTEALIPSLKRVQNLDSVLLLQGSIATRVLGGDAPFTLSTVNFVDGPYLDINATDTTLTLSGRTGSVTVTASATTGINDDTGFQTTDVGRLIRFQGGPEEWDVGTTYGKFQHVTGSDGQVYYSVISGNIGNDPTTDSGTHWLPSIIVVTWTWLKITAVDPAHLVCTATIMGSDLTATDALVTDAWRLGLYSDTTGWPTVGAYHEGRIWLAGVLKNRVDGGTSNNLDPHNNKAMPFGSLCFSPTDTDGTVSDSNAVSAIPNAAEADVILWMTPDAQGLVLGTQASEWSVRASSLDDPITPTSIQMRRVTTAGCADVEPLWAWEKIVFVQRELHKVVEHSANSYLGPSRYYYDNLSHLVDTLVAEGVAEIKWQQEPLLTVWARMQDGSLNAFFYKKPQFRLTTNEESLGSVSWHRHMHGQERIFESISTGPSGFERTGLFTVTNNTDEDASDFGIRQVEVLTPLFNAGLDDCAAFFVDGGSVPCCTEKKAISNGDTFDGLRIWGFNLLEGQTVKPYLGNLNVGSYVVTDAHIDIPWNATFTEAYFDSLDTCDDTGATATQRVDTTPTPTNTGGLIAYVGAASTVPYAVNGGDMMVGHDSQKFYLRQIGATPGLMRFDCDTDVEEQEATELDIFGDDGMGSPLHTLGNTTGYCYADGFIYTTADGSSNSAPIAKINATTFVADQVWGIVSSSLAQSTTGRIVLSFNMAAGMTTGGRRYLASCGIRSANVINEVAILDAGAEVDPAVPLLYAAQIDETHALVCVGRQAGAVSFIVIGGQIVGSPTSDPFAFYEFWCDGDSITRRKIGTLSPPDIDATWTNFNAMSNPGFDNADGNILAFFSTSDAVTTKKYLAKVNSITGALMWKVAVNGSPDLAKSQFNGWWEFYDYNVSPSRHSVVTVDLSDGALTATTLWNLGLSLSGSQIYGCHMGTITHSGAITMRCGYSVSGTPVPIYLGEYLAAHSDTIPAGRHGRIFNGSVCPSHQDTEFPFYGCVGFTYTSRGQLLRPDFGEDAGTRAGPAFAKKRRVHSYAAALIRTQGISFGTSFDKLNAAPLTRHGEGWVSATPPNLFSDTVKTEINDDLSYSGQICWEQTGADPGTIVAIAGFIESSDG